MPQKERVVVSSPYRLCTKSQLILVHLTEVGCFTSNIYVSLPTYKQLYIYKIGNNGLTIKYRENNSLNRKK